MPGFHTKVAIAPLTRIHSYRWCRDVTDSRQGNVETDQRVLMAPNSNSIGRSRRRLDCFGWRLVLLDSGGGWLGHEWLFANQGVVFR